MQNKLKDMIHNVNIPSDWKENPKYYLGQMLRSKKTYAIAVPVLVILGLIVFGIVHYSNKTVDAANFFHKRDGLISQGTIEVKSVNINSKVPGRVQTIYVEEGQTVKAGDKLVEISSDELRAKKAQAEAGVAQAEAALKAAKEQYEQAKAGLEASNGLVKQAEAGVKAATGKQQEAQAGVVASQKQQEAASAIKEKADNGARAQEIAQAEVAYNIMKTSYDRVKLLAEKGAVSQQKLDEVKAQLDLAEQTLSMAKEGARLEDKKAATATSEQAQAGVEASKTRVEQAEAGVQAAQAQLTQAMAGVQSSQALLYQAQAGVEAKEGLVAQAKAVLAEVDAYLNDVVIVAPMDGVVTSINSEEGELVSTGTQIAVVSNLEGAWVTANIMETDLANIYEGQSVTVKVPSYPDKTFKGTVKTINQQPNFAVKRATKDNGSFDIVSFGVKVKLDNDDCLLRPGMSAFLQFQKK
ncbi:MAG: HlyD family secretion protein [Epulopiscium sp.]|jgi:HlyD family secretion protein|nr:HlyD family secretion protein [Candidatus Epulonipiscium sp.]